MQDDDGLMAAPLVRALQGPAAPGELAGEAAALSAFRRATAARPRRHALRVVTGASALVLAMTVSGGVAAAYTTTLLPAPVQDVAHGVIASIGVIPAPHESRRQLRRQLAVATHRANAQHPSPAPPALVPPAPSPSPGTHAVQPGRVRPSPTAAAPSAAASPAPRATLTAGASRRAVPVHQGLDLRGVMTRSGKALANQTVYAAVYDVGGSAWRRVASGQTASDGTIVLHVGPLVRNGRVRLAGQGVFSAAIRITVIPRVVVSLARNAAGDRYVVSVRADGGASGDRAVLQRYDGTQWVDVASHSLTAEARTRYVIPVPTADPVRYRVRLAATAVHGPSGAGFTAQP
ncbi:MAG: hypothetical protein JWP11_1471 [Frankiales bacterium]|nr:hypothetical protein [Frankiales bacterium]